MEANAQPYGAVLPEAEAIALTPPRSDAKIRLAGRFDQVLIIFWTYWVFDIPEVVRVGVPIREQVRHDQILVSPAFANSSQLRTVSSLHSAVAVDGLSMMKFTVPWFWAPSSSEIPMRHSL